MLKFLTLNVRTVYFKAFVLILLFLY